MNKRRCTWITKHRYVKRTMRCEDRAVVEAPVQYSRYGHPVTWLCAEHSDELMRNESARTNRIESWIAREAR